MTGGDRVRCARGKVLSRLPVVAGAGSWRQLKLAAFALVGLLTGCDNAPDTEPVGRADSKTAEPALRHPTTRASTGTEQQLDSFFEQHGGRERFPPSYVEAVETLLRAEDEVAAGEYRAARQRLETLFARYPRSDPVWWRGIGKNSHGVFGTNVGTPVAYYGLRMLDEITRVGVKQPTGVRQQSLRMTVLVVQCANGRRPTNVAMSTDEPVHLSVHPSLAQDDYRIVRQSLRLFRHYVWALTDGRLTLSVDVEPVERCATVTYSKKPRIAGLSKARDIVAHVDEALRRRTDMWWLIYPSNVPAARKFDSVAFITGGMGQFDNAPLFIIDDLWLVRKPPHLGRGPYTDTERRVYLPQWLQHEYFHHLFGRYRALRLEERGHQWFDRSTWPRDFVGEWEPDYYAEALAKRLRRATPPLHQALRVAPDWVDLSALTVADLTGRFVREPIQNNYHEVTVEVRDGQLIWRNAANVSWSLIWRDGRLRTGPDCPYGERTVGIETRFAPDGVATHVTGLVFLSESYRRP